MRMSRQARSQEGLQPGHGTARDITAHQVGVPPLQIGRARGVGGQDGIAKSGAKRSIWAAISSVTSPG